MPLRQGINEVRASDHLPLHMFMVASELQKHRAVIPKKVMPVYRELAQFSAMRINFENLQMKKVLKESKGKPLLTRFRHWYSAYDVLTNRGSWEVSTIWHVMYFCWMILCLDPY